MSELALHFKQHFCVNCVIILIIIWVKIKGHVIVVHILFLIKENIIYFLFVLAPNEKYNIYFSFPYIKEDIKHVLQKTSYAHRPCGH